MGYQEYENSEVQDSNEKKMTVVHCRYCGRRTFTSVRYGDVCVFCPKCKRIFRVRIEGEHVAGSEEKGTENSGSQSQ